MQQVHLLAWLALFMTLSKCTDSFELFIRKTNEASVAASSEPPAPFLNQSYELPLFQRHYVTVRVLPSEFHSKGDNRSVVGYNLQVRSTNAPVVIVEKVQSLSGTPERMGNQVESTLLNDLYIGE